MAVILLGDTDGYLKSTEAYLYVRIGTLRVPSPKQRRDPMRMLRVIGLALLAVFGLTAVAAAQTNKYDFTGAVPSGGSKAKPKATGFTFNFAINDADGNIPAPVKSYKFTIGGTKVNTAAVKATCTAASINAKGDASGCSTKAIVGTGSVTAVIGVSGQPLSAKAGDCTLKLTAYAAGANKVALFLNGGSPGAPACLVPIAQAIDAKWSNGSKGASLTFAVPDQLRHQVGLDVPVLSVKSTWKKLTGAKGKTKVGYVESVGCKGQRSATATFTDEAGTATPVTKAIGTC
jgi:hypothetical protein